MKSYFNHCYLGICILLLLSISHSAFSDTVAKDQWVRTTVNGIQGSKEVLVNLVELTADVDLYVRKGQEPTLTEFDCRPALPGVNEEACLIALAEGETAQIGVFGVEAGDFFVVPNFIDDQQPGPNEPQPLILGRLTPGSVQSNQYKYYVFDSSTLPALSDEFLVRSPENYDGFGVELVANLTDLSADADLLVGIDALPTKDNGQDQCFTKPGGTNDEECGVFLKDLKDRQVFIGITGDNTNATFKVQVLIQKTINVLPANIQQVNNNGFSESAEVLKGQWNYYQVNPGLVSSASSIAVTMKPTESDVDLYVRSQAPPISLHWDCFANLAETAQEVCTINNPDPNQLFYFGVFGFTKSKYDISVNIN